MTDEKPITALIVDDSPDSLSMLNTALNNQGMTVLVALGGEQALNIIDLVKPDIVLLDAVMPVMDGFEVCRRLKIKKPQLPIIFMTGLTDTKDIVRGFEAGAVDYVVKPLNTDEVHARIRVHVQNAKNLLSAKAALDAAGQSIIAVDVLGTVSWATKRAQDLLDLYDQNTDILSRDISRAITQVWNISPGEPVLLEGFSDPHHNKINAIHLNLHGNHHLIRLSGTSEVSDLNTLAEKLPITRREAEVLLWLQKGKSNWDIATILAIKPRTINKHLEQMFKKLNVDNRTAAAALAISALSAADY